MNKEPMYLSMPEPLKDYKGSLLIKFLYGDKCINYRQGEVGPVLMPDCPEDTMIILYTVNGAKVPVGPVYSYNKDTESWQMDEEAPCMDEQPELKSDPLADDGTMSSHLDLSGSTKVELSKESSPDSYSPPSDSEVDCGSEADDDEDDDDDYVEDDEDDDYAYED